MKMKLIMKLVASFSLIVLVTKAEIILDNLGIWESFCDNAVEGGVTLVVPAERQLRDICFTNVFMALTTNKYELVTIYPPRDCDVPYLQMQGADYKAIGSDAFFEVSYVTSSNKITGGLMGVIELQIFYTTRGGKIFMQYQDGPGDVCLLDTSADVANPTTIHDVFFSRDNVAVQVRGRNASNILEFARLLDACILSSPVETLPVTQ